MDKWDRHNFDKLKCLKIEYVTIIFECVAKAGKRITSKTWVFI